MSQNFFLDFVHIAIMFCVMTRKQLVLSQILLEKNRMKIAISAMEGNLDATVDARFGRAAWFLIVDSTTGQLIEAIDNSNGKASAQGAGIGTAALIADKGVQAVLTGKVGPKATPVLEKANVQIVNEVSGTVQDAIASFARENKPTTSERPAQSVQTAQAAMGQGKCGQGKGRGKEMRQGRGRCQCKK